MNRREFLRRTGLAAVAVWLGGNVEATPVEMAVNPYVVEPKIFNVADTIFAVDPSEVPSLQMLGSGIRYKLSDWPSYKVEWIEDKLTPAQPGEPGYFDYTNYVDTDPYKDDCIEDYI